MLNIEKFRQSRVLGLVAVSRASEVDTLNHKLYEEVILKFIFTQTPSVPRI